MEWIKFKDKQPNSGKRILYRRIDDISDSIALMFTHSDGSLRSAGYYCNNPECDWIYDDCCCAIIVRDDDYWMDIPSLKEEDGM